jgi:molecular chaperone GrpE
MAKKETPKKNTAEAEIEEFKIGWQRCQADFDNFKKRTIAEKAIWQEEARIDFLSEMLPILDNLSLMTASRPPEIENNPWVQGVVIICKQINETLAEMNVEKIEPNTNDKFDHNLHDAISSEASDQVEPDHIIKTLKPGYKINDRIIRPAVVVTSSHKS